MSKSNSNHHSGGGDTLAGDQQIEDRIFPNVADGLLVRDHREIVAIALEYLVVYPQTRFGGSTFIMDLRHVDAL